MFKIKKIRGDGRCIFGALAFFATQQTGTVVTTPALLTLLGDHIVHLAGKIPFYNKDGQDLGDSTFQAQDEHNQPLPNTVTFEVMRGGERLTASVAEFREFLINGRDGVKLYGGDECIAAFVNLYQVFRVRF